MAKNLISIEELDPELSIAPEFTPRSKKACKRLGIEPYELIYHKPSEFMTKGMDETTATPRFQYVEQKRLEKIKWIKEEYMKIVEGDVKSKQEKPNHAISVESGDMVDKEKRQLEKFERRQQQELQKLIDYELRMEDMRQRNEEKAEKAFEREEIRRKEIMKRRKEQEDRRIREEERKCLMRIQEEEDQKKRAQEEYERLQKKLKEDQKKEKERMQDAKTKEMERKLKQEEFKRRTEEMMQMQQKWIEEQKDVLEEREEKRKEILLKKQKGKIEENARTQVDKQAKLRMAKLNLESIIQFNRVGYEKKQKLSENKMKKIEEEREKARIDAAKRAEQKGYEIKRVQEMNTLFEQKRKGDLLKANEEADRRYQEQIKLKEIKLKKRKEEEELKNEQAELTRKRQEEIEENRIKKLLIKREKEELMVKKTVEQKEQSIKVKREEEEVKRADRHENLVRITRQIDYHKEEVLEKIKEDYDRVESLKNMREQLLQERKKKKEKAEAEKLRILTLFDHIKKKKGNLKEYSSMFNSMLTPQSSVLQVKSQTDLKKQEGKSLNNLRKEVPSKEVVKKQLDASNKLEKYAKKELGKPSKAN